jgi:hypothetical protein
MSLDTSAVIGLSGIKGQATSVGFPQVVTVDQKNAFESMVSSKPDVGISAQVGKVIDYVQSRFNEKHDAITESVKNFENTGSAVALMVASHQGANKSIMVQLVGTVSKKSADSAEQIYKQQ